MITTLNDDRLTDKQKDWIIRQRKNYVAESSVDVTIDNNDIMDDDDWDNWDYWVTKVRHKIWNDADNYETTDDLTINIEKDSSTYHQPNKGYYVYNVEKGLIGYCHSLDDATKIADGHYLGNTTYYINNFACGYFASRNKLSKEEFDERVSAYREKQEKVVLYYLYHYQRGFIGTASSRKELRKLADNHYVDSTKNKFGNINNGYFVSTRELNDDEIKDWCSNYKSTKQKELYIYNKDGLIKKYLSIKDAEFDCNINLQYRINKKEPFKGCYYSLSPVDDDELKIIFANETNPSMVKPKAKELFVYTKDGLYKKYKKLKDAKKEIGNSIVIISLYKRKVCKGFYCSYRELNDNEIQEMFKDSPSKDLIYVFTKDGLFGKYKSFKEANDATGISTFYSYTVSKPIKGFYVTKDDIESWIEFYS